MIESLGDLWEEVPDCEELWQAEPGYRELLEDELEASFERARLQQLEFYCHQMEVLLRRAWHCPILDERGCLDAPRRRWTASKHATDHLHPFYAARKAYSDSYGPFYHWGQHLEGNGCVIRVFQS